MHNKGLWFQRLWFIANVGVITLLTVAVALYAIHPLMMFSSVRSVSVTKAEQKSMVVTKPVVTVISGRPIQIVIPGSSYDGKIVNLPLDEGYYDTATNAWTLSATHAQFMMISSLANNFEGETYIYGHNNDNVFGALRHVTPNPGSTAYLYTANGHILSYSFVSVSSVAPDTTSVLEYEGSPIMIIQTCTGSFNEERTLYKYAFNSVIQ